MHQRGVFRETYRAPDGTEILVAVNREGKIVARACLTDRCTRPEVIRAFRSLLQKLDPPPPLHLIR